MTFDELMNIRKYLTSACMRLTALQEKCDIETFDQWQRFGNSWDVVRAYMDAHTELP